MMDRYNATVEKSQVGTGAYIIINGIIILKLIKRAKVSKK